PARLPPPAVPPPAAPPPSYVPPPPPVTPGFGGPGAGPPPFPTPGPGGFAGAQPPFPGPAPSAGSGPASGYGPPPGYPQQPVPYGPGSVSPPANSSALTGLIVGIVALVLGFTCLAVPWLAGIAADTRPPPRPPPPAGAAPVPPPPQPAAGPASAGRFAGPPPYGPGGAGPAWQLAPAGGLPPYPMAPRTSGTAIGALVVALVGLFL